MTTFRVSNTAGRWSALLDGVDIANIIRDGSLRIEFPTHGQPPVVHMQLITSEIDVDLPGASVALEVEAAA